MREVSKEAGQVKDALASNWKTTKDWELSIQI